MYSKRLERIVEKGIKGSPETMEFLRAQALEIMQEARTKWEYSASEEDLKDPEAWWDYYHDASKKFEKYFARWFVDLKHNIPFIAFYEKMPHSICDMFENMIDEVIETVDLSEIESEIMNEVIDNEHENRKKNICEGS